MCWSKYEREQWERERREAEAERLRFISTTEPKTEPEPEVEADERETELRQRGLVDRLRRDHYHPGRGRRPERCGPLPALEQCALADQRAGADLVWDAKISVLPANR